MLLDYFATTSEKLRVIFIANHSLVHNQCNTKEFDVQFLNKRFVIIAQTSGEIPSTRCTTL